MVGKCVNGKELKKIPFLEELGQVGTMGVTEPCAGHSLPWPRVEGAVQVAWGSHPAGPHGEVLEPPCAGRSPAPERGPAAVLLSLGHSGAIAPLAPAGAAHQGGMCPAPRPEHPPRAAREEKLGFILFELV